MRSKIPPYAGVSGRDATTAVFRGAHIQFLHLLPRWWHPVAAESHVMGLANSHPLHGDTVAVLHERAVKESETSCTQEGTTRLRG